MLNNRREYKRKRYEALAATSKIFSSPRRLEIIDALLQQPSSVEQLASSVEHSVATTSQHLQILKRAHVVRTVRVRTTITYHLVDEIKPIFVALRQLAERENPALKILKNEAQTGISMISFEQISTLLQDDKAVIIDIRSSDEFNTAHIQDALSVPYRSLDQYINKLPREKAIVVVCRGPYCTTSFECVEQLREKGFQAYCYDGGIGEWQHHGGALVIE